MVPQHGRVLLVERRHGKRTSLLERIRLAKDERIRDRATADHHAVDSRLLEPRERARRRDDVARTDHRDADVSFHLRNAVPVGPALVALLLRATVDRDHLSAAVLDQARDVDTVDQVVVPAGADLDRHRDRDDFADAAQDLLELRQVLEEVRPASAAHDALGRTAAVDVENVGAGLLDDLGSLDHSRGVVAEDLDRDRTLLGKKPQHPVRLEIAARQTFDAHELGDDQPDAAEFLDEPAERRIGDARHRRENQVWRDADAIRDGVLGLHRNEKAYHRPRFRPKGPNLDARRTRSV